MALLLGGARRLAACGARARWARPFAAQPEPEQASGDEITVKVNDYKAHKLDPPGTEVTTSKGELIEFFTTMYRMRRRARTRLPLELVALALQPVQTLCVLATRSRQLARAVAKRLKGWQRKLSAVPNVAPHSACGQYVSLQHTAALKNVFAAALLEHARRGCLFFRFALSVLAQAELIPECALKPSLPGCGVTG